MPSTPCGRRWNKSTEAAAILIESLCDQFEMSHRHREHAKIKDCLDAVPHPSCNQLLCELIQLKLTYLKESDMSVGINDYLTRFADDRECIERAFQQDNTALFSTDD